LGNYKKYGEMIGVDLVAHPELANDPDNAAKILALYFENTGVVDLIKEGKITEARSKINPDNKGRMIMKTYEKYLEALKS
jgi:predicted chitinase